MEHLQAPKPFEQGPSPAANWKTWKKRFSRYAHSIDLFAKPEKRQVNVLLHVAGDEVQDIADTFEFREADGTLIEEDEITYEMMMERLDLHYIPKSNVTYERRQFFSSMQGMRSIDDYVTELCKLARTCEYENKTEDFIKDQLVGGINNEQVKERLLRTEGLTLPKALEIARAAELSKRHMESFMPVERTVNAMQEGGKKTYHKQWLKKEKPKQRTDNQRMVSTSQNREFKNNCFKCGRTHEFRNCPAFGKECYVCKRKNHFGSVCKSRNKASHELTVVEDAGALFIDELTKLQCKPGMYEPVKVEGKEILLKLDTGAQANVISESLVREIQCEQWINPTKVHLKTYTKEEIPLVGQVQLSCQTRKQTEMLRFLVTKNDYEPVLGMEACTEGLHLINRTVNAIKCNTQIQVETATRAEIIVKRYIEVFKGICRLDGEYHITLQPNTRPVVHAPREIPFALLPAVEKELHKMEAMGVISKVTEPTEWVHPMVIIHKPNGTLRICIDPGELNRAMKRAHFKMPTIEDVAAKLKGAVVFTVLDATSAFWHKKLDESSSYLCTFATPFGRYRFL